MLSYIKPGVITVLNEKAVLKMTEGGGASICDLYDALTRTILYDGGLRYITLLMRDNNRFNEDAHIKTLRAKFQNKFSEDELQSIRSGDVRDRKTMFRINFAVVSLDHDDARHMWNNMSFLDKLYYQFLYWK